MDLLQRQLAPKCFCTFVRRWCDPVMGGSPPGSAGVPPAQILSQLRPSPPPESTGSGALPLLRPGPCGSRRQGGRLHLPASVCHFRDIAGKLSGNRRDSMRAGRPRSRGCRPDGEVGGIRRATSLKAGLSPLGNSRLPASRAPAPRDWADPSRRTINWNIDAQDAQDNQDRRLLQETRTRAMIGCGFEDVREHKPAVSGKNPVHPVHRCESKIYPCLTMNRFPATRRRGLFQVSVHHKPTELLKMVSRGLISETSTVALAMVRS